MDKLEKLEEILEDFGELDDTNTCPFCNNTSLFRIDKYDAYCCVICNVWTEQQCSDPTCEYCSSRPLLPSDVIKVESVDIQKAWQELATTLVDRYKKTRFSL